MTEVTASARVTVTVEVSHCGTWGEECSAKQIRDQASENALSRIRRMCLQDPHAKVVGEAKVEMILAKSLG